MKAMIGLKRLSVAKKGARCEASAVNLIE